MLPNDLRSLLCAQQIRSVHDKISSSKFSSQISAYVIRLLLPQFSQFPIRPGTYHSVGVMYRLRMLDRNNIFHAPGLARHFKLPALIVREVRISYPFMSNSFVIASASSISTVSIRPCFVQMTQLPKPPMMAFTAA